MRRTILLAGALSVGLALAACSDDDEFTEENLRTELVDANLLEEEAADCVAASVFDQLSDDEIDEIQDASVSEGDVPEPLQDALTTAIGECI